MAELKEGDSLAHFIGPLGKAAEIEEFGHVVCMASGYGIGGMLPIIRGLKEVGNRVTTILQAPDEESLFYREEHESLADTLLLGTGAAGGNGAAGPTALSPLHRLLGGHKEDPIDRVIAMGSICMMRLICLDTKPYGIKTMVHMAPVMVDGTGMCGACRFLTDGGTRFACVHGPEYDGHEVKGWEVLMARRCTYGDESVKQAGFMCRSCSQW
jgi:ferredoxin--NADP+ reductase